MLASQALVLALLLIVFSHPEAKTQSSLTAASLAADALALLCLNLKMETIMFQMQIVSESNKNFTSIQSISTPGGRGALAGGPALRPTVPPVGRS